MQGVTLSKNALAVYLKRRKPGCVCAGHSSWSASGLCFITWWLLDRLRVFDGSGHPWRLLAAVMPAMAALAVGVSRYTDYWCAPVAAPGAILPVNAHDHKPTYISCFPPPCAGTMRVI